MFNARLGWVRHATGEAERRLLKDETEFRSVLRDGFGLNLTDDEIRTCILGNGTQGCKGAPHPFFASDPTHRHDDRTTKGMEDISRWSVTCNAARFNRHRDHDPSRKGVSSHEGDITERSESSVVIRKALR